MNKKTLIVIAGPTAIGKTALAIEIAKHFNTEIISADSRQFFKEMSIGTAKPTIEELSAAKHHFINSHSITEEFSVGMYEKQALNLIEKLFKIHDVLILVGGSGLYINAILNGFDELPDISENVRSNLNTLFTNKGIEYLQEKLKKVDPKYYSEVDINNPQRVIRALEVYESTGKPFSSFRTGQKKKRNFNHILITLNTDREILYSRINQRVDLMIKDGLIEEVKLLTPYKHLNSLNTVGYSEIFEYLDGNISLEKAIDAVKQNTRRFAKRQITWFKRNEDTTWFKPEEKEKVISYIEKEMTK